MDIFLQSKLLRALQTLEIMKIGDNEVIPIKVRIIAATNKQPMEEVKKSRLRTDLYYRLNVLDLQIPPLRERKGEADFLFLQFLEKISRKRKQAVHQPSAKLLDAINKYTWPGNVRELENFAEKYATLQNFLRHRTLQTYLLPIDEQLSEKATLNEIVTNEVLKVSTGKL